MRSLEDILSEWRGDIAALHRTGRVSSATLMERMLKDVELATAEYRTWLTIPRAAFRSRRSERHWRRKFPELLSHRLARFNPANPRQREILQVCVPLRPSLDDAREAGRRAVDRRSR